MLKRDTIERLAMLGGFVGLMVALREKDRAKQFAAIASFVAIALTVTRKDGE